MCELQLAVTAFVDRTAGATPELPETAPHAHFFFSEHVDAARTYVSVPLRVVGEPDADGWQSLQRPQRVHMRSHAPPAARLGPGAALGIEMYARSHIDRRRVFQVPVGSAVLYVQQLLDDAAADGGDGTLEYDVELRDWSDKNGDDGDTDAYYVKGVLRVRVDAVRLYDGVVVERESMPTEASADNYWRLQAYCGERCTVQLRAYRQQGLRAASESVARTHVVRYVTSPSGRQVQAAYFLAQDAPPRLAMSRRWVDGAPRVWVPYWESALRASLALDSVRADEFLALDTASFDAIRLVAQAATLFANAGVVYVNDHNNRGRRRGQQAIVDVERFMDVLITRAGDCEDVAVLTYRFLVALHQLDPAAGCTAPVAHAARVLQQRYVPFVVTGEAVDPAAPARDSVDEHEQRGEFICHVYCVLLPASFVMRCIARSGSHDGIALAEPLPDGDGGHVLVCEGTAYQDPLPRPFTDYADDAELRALLRRHDEALDHATHRRWNVPLRIAHSAPFYGRLVALWSSVFHERFWVFSAAYADTGTYGVRMADFAAQSDRVAMQALVEQTPYDHAVSTDVLRQCHPVLPPRALNPSALGAAATGAARFEARDAVEALCTKYPVPPRTPASDALIVRRMRYVSTRWWLEAPPTPADLADMRKALADGTFVGAAYYVHPVCGGTEGPLPAPDDEHGTGDCVARQSVSILEIRLFVY